MIATEPTPAHNPSEAALHHPSSGKRAKSFGEELVLLHFDAFGHEQTLLGAVRAYTVCMTHHTFQRSQPMKVLPWWLLPQSSFIVGKLCLLGLEHPLGSELFGAVGTDDLDSQRIPLRIHENVPFAIPLFSPGS